MSSKKRSAASLESGAEAAHADKKHKDKHTPGAGKISRQNSATKASKNNASSTPASSSSSSQSVALTPAAYSPAAAGLHSSFQTYTSSTSERANIVLHQLLPRKVLELDAMISGVGPFEPSVRAPFKEDGSMEAGAERQVIPSNASVMRLIPSVKREIQTQIDLFGALKLMIQLRIPAVDDGNNFGVEIQEESANEIAKAEDVVFSYLERLQAYYGNRTRLVAKISKYAGVLDYWQGLAELDESFYVDLRLQLTEMRNQYSAVHDLVVKNEDRIKNPRGEAETEGRSRRHAFA